MKKLILTGCLFASAQFAQSSTVNWASATDTVLLSSNPNNITQLPLGNIIRLGFFNIDNATILGFHNAANFTALDSAFTQFDQAFSGEGTDDPGNGVPPTAGAFAKGSTVGGTPLANQQVFIWVLQATNNSSLAQALATVTAEAIFYVDKTGRPDWQFPATFNGVANFDLGEITNASGGLASGASVVVGNLIANVNRPDLAAAFSAPRIEGIQVVAPVPEPTSVFLIAAGAAGLMMRRRRQS